jgi:quercetin dioxygenase-like cupin family protein
MPNKQVIITDDVPFGNVEWGRSKILVSPATNGAEHLRVGVTEYHPGTPHEPHSHPGQEEVIWVLSGHGYTETHGARQPPPENEPRPGALAYIPAGLEHKTAAEDGPMTAIVIKSPASDIDGTVS